MATWRLMCYACFFMLRSCSGIQSEKSILMFVPMGGSRTSHFQIGRKLAQGLADRGYHVDIVLGLGSQGDSSSKDGDNENDNASNINYKFYDATEAVKPNLTNKTEKYFETPKYSKVYPFLRMAFEGCRCLFQDGEVINDVRNKSYQLIIGATLNPCHVVLADTLNVTNLVHIHYALKDMFDHWLFPVQSWDKSLPIRDKLDKLTEISQNYNFMKTLFSWYNELAKEITGIGLSFDTFLNPAVWLLNSHSVLDGNRLLGTNMVEIGGLTARAGKPLMRQDIDRFLQEAKSEEGCIVFSVNTVIGSVHSEIADKFARTFGRLPVRVVWKHVSKTAPINLRNNTMVIPWMEENDINDILAYGNVKVFLTTGGRTGLFEAIYHAIPVICFPVFEEHFDNCNKIVRRGFGKILDLGSSSENDIYQAIMDLISDERYKISASRWSSVFHSLPVPHDTAISRIISVLENGADVLSANNHEILLPLSLMFDIIFYFFLGVFSFCLVLCFLYKTFAVLLPNRKVKSE